MATENANRHLTLEERRIIRTGIENGSEKAAIAKTIGKDNSTIGKEIRLHRILKVKCDMPLECKNYRKCAFDRQCTLDCPDYDPFTCKRRDRSPGACNGCGNYSKCRFNKFYYEPEAAQNEYRETLVDSRSGANLTTMEAKAITDVVAPLLKQGQSPYQIIKDHPELGICEKTLYNYIENRVLNVLSDISSISLRRTVSRKIPKRNSEIYKKREPRKYLEGRQYKDYLEYLDQHPNAYVVQMDTVYNDESNGPFIQTFKLMQSRLTFAVFHEHKTTESMTNGLNLLEAVLGKELFNKHVEVLLTDRGTEFSAPDALESREDNTTRTRVFYCDPMCSNQKGSLENKHIELRYICPKHVDLRALGLTGQDKLNLVLSHLNSSPCEKLAGKSPLEYAEFMFPDLVAKFNEFQIVQIPKDDIILRPYLLKS